ncbi:hypothetical protein BY996DRAFT_6437661 [Phakopsora pachyrhizi]|nr:hypothetical protein BY996DRAFT_6437661 [Phakopsora pachyrhizi]
MSFYSTEDFSRIIFRASKLTTVIVRFNQSRSRKNLDDDDCLDFYEEHHNSNCGNSINKDYLGWNTVIKSELKTLENIDYDRDGSAIDDEGSKEIIQEFDFESCEIPELRVRVSEVRLLRNILAEDLSSQRLQLNGQNCFWRGEESQLKRRMRADGQMRQETWDQRALVRRITPGITDSTLKTPWSDVEMFGSTMPLGVLKFYSKSDSRVLGILLFPTPRPLVPAGLGTFESHPQALTQEYLQDFWRPLDFSTTG